MHRRTLLVIPFVALTASACDAETWMLVTPDEVARESAAPHPFTMSPPSTRALTAGPAIVVEQPPVTGPLHAPISFRLRFVPEAGSAIDLHTFRATYGMLGLDITARLLQHAKFTGEELFADNVNIPAGNHMVTLAIADTLGHESSRTFQFTVV